MYISQHCLQFPVSVDPHLRLLGEHELGGLEVQVVQLQRVHQRLLLGLLLHLDHLLRHRPRDVQLGPAPGLALLHLDLELGAHHVGGAGLRVHDTLQLQVQVEICILLGEVKMDY